MTSKRTRLRLVQRLRDGGITNESVLSVMVEMPRHLFLDEALAHRAYEDTALPIGHNQTISQPYIVARMTEIAFLSGPLTNVLEIGTGCGYQTSILARLAKRVTTVERIKPLLDKAHEMRCLELLRLLPHRRSTTSVQSLIFVPKKSAQLVAHRATFLFADDLKHETKLFGTAQTVA